MNIENEDSMYRRVIFRSKMKKKVEIFSVSPTLSHLTSSTKCVLFGACEPPRPVKRIANTYKN